MTTTAPVPRDLDYPRPCAACGQPAYWLCDDGVERGEAPCDAPCCQRHLRRQGRFRSCPEHAA